MSDTLQEGEDARTRHEQIGGEYRCNKCRAEFKTIPDFDKHECKQQREDQTGEHQVNRSGVCQIPGCPCRGWSAQETAGVKETTMTTEERIKQIPACVECGAVQFARYGHFPECSQFIADLDKVKFDSEHQPAARGGGEEWRYIETTYSAEVVIGSGPSKIMLKPHWTGLADANEIRQTMQRITTEHNQHHSLVAEREQMVEALKGVAIMLNTELEKYNKEPWAQRVRAAITASEQRSTSE